MPVSIAEHSLDYLSSSVWRTFSMHLLGGAAKLLLNHKPSTMSVSGPNSYDAGQLVLRQLVSECFDRLLMTASSVDGDASLSGSNMTDVLQLFLSVVGEANFG